MPPPISLINHCTLLPTPPHSREFFQGTKSLQISAEIYLHLQSPKSSYKGVELTVSFSQCLAVLVFQLRTPAGLDKMAFLKLALFALLAAPALGERRLRGNVQRDQRSLTNTFPFNQKAGAEEHHGEHHEAHHGHHETSDLPTRDNRQGADVDVSFPAVAAAGPGSDGKRCIDKVEMVEETEYDDVV